MLKVKKEISDLLSLVFLMSLATSMFSLFYGMGVNFEKTGLFVFLLALACVLLFFFFSRVPFFNSRNFALINALFSFFISVFFLTLSRCSEPTIFGNRNSPVLYLAFSSLLLAENCSEDRRGMLLLYLTLFYSMVLVLLYSLCGLVIFNMAVLIYVFFSMRKFFVRFVMFEFALALFTFLFLACNYSLMYGCVSSFFSNSRKFNPFVSFIESFGVIGFVFETLIISGLFFSLVHDGFTMSFSVFATVLMILALVSFDKVLDFDFSFMSNSVLTLVTDTLILGIISNRENENGKQEVSCN